MLSNISMSSFVSLTVVPTHKDATTRPTGPPLIELKDGVLGRIELRDLLQWHSLNALGDSLDGARGQDGPRGAVSHMVVVVVGGMGLGGHGRGYPQWLPIRRTYLMFLL